MPIKQLSDETARFLRSTLALNDACSVVKELVDNALDASASVITIEISANALDVIQIKDNGTGIDVEDRQLLCKRGCTSKIKTLQDLEKLGGQSLGFRGEALSSITEMSEHVVVTTRVEGEVVGTAMKFGSRGKLLSSASASHPIGTSIRIERFLSKIPVRKQAALKNCNKVLTNLKKLMMTYAFVRPHVRQSLKVLKRENDKANWSFAPCNGADRLLEVATQVFGKEIATCCRFKAASLTTATGDSYAAEAILLDSAADFSKLGTVGQFIAVDRRPVTAERGLMSEMAKIYKRYLRNSVSHESRIPSKPLLVLQIDCPENTYDVNIEPAKDEVLFHQPSFVIELGEKLFSEFYGSTVDEPSQTQATKPSAQPIVRAFDILLARKKDGGALTEGDASRSDMRLDPQGPTPSIDKPILETTQLRTQTSSPESPRRKSVAYSNMYEADDDGYDNEQTQMSDVQDVNTVVDESVSDLSTGWVQNPFTTAALHARIPPRNVTTVSKIEIDNASQRPAIASSNTILHSPDRQYQDNLHTNDPASQQYLPTPSRSPIRQEPYQNPGPPIPRFPKRGCMDEEDEDLSDTSPRAPNIEPQQRVLSEWITSSAASQTTPYRTDPISYRGSGSGTRTISSPRKNSSDGIADTGSLNSQLASSIVANHVRSPVTMQSQPFSSKQPSENAISMLQSQPRDAELDQIMAFEHRKRAVNRRPAAKSQSNPNPAELLRLQQRSMANSLRLAPAPTDENDSSHPRQAIRSDGEYEGFDMPSQTSNPHSNRYHAALRTLGSRRQENSDNIDDFYTAIDQTDNIEDVIYSDIDLLSTTHTPPNQQTSTSSTQTRTQSRFAPHASKIRASRLPFETISTDYIKHNVQCIPPAEFSDTSSIQRQIKTLGHSDSYLKTGRVMSTDWSPFSRQVHIWQSKLENLIRSNYTAKQIDTTTGSISNQDKTNHDGNQSSANVKIDLTQAIKCHLHMLEKESSLRST